MASGLLTQEEIDEAIDLVRAELRNPKKVVSDERLSAKLVELGRLNKWQAEQLRAGRTKFNLGPYHIIDSCGQGGMGHVFKAEHTVMGRVVAVKVLPRHKSTPEAIVSFTREIRAQAQLDHENLVRAYDAGQDGNVHFLVTEYVPGTDLRRLIRRHGRLSMSAASSIMSQASRGLEHAHNRGLLHRDVKPGNLLVTPEGHTKVSDLGLAGYFSEAEQTDSRGGKVVGTADYLAPEQIMQPDRLTPALDIYSLGCTLYYAVTGKVPFPGGTAREKARMHCQLAPLDPRRLNPELDDSFVEVLADMMAKDPSLRIQTANEVMKRLAPWSKGGMPEFGPVAVGAPTPLGAVPQMRRPIPLAMKDTEPNFLVQPTDEPGQGESPSQTSLGTQPVAGSSDETSPLALPEREVRRLRARARLLNSRTRLLVGLGVAAVGALIVAMLAWN